MAKIDDDSILNFITGTLGKQIVVKRSKSGKRYLSAKPETHPNRKLTPSQARYRSRFKKQAAYAKSACNNPVTKNLYLDRARPGCSAYIMAWLDAHHPPTVKNILTDGYYGREGDILFITAEDDFMVVDVQVRIYYTNYEVIEKGKASLHSENLWTYKTSANTKGSTIEVIAYDDRPGNEGKMTLAV